MILEVVYSLLIWPTYQQSYFHEHLQELGSNKSLVYDLYAQLTLSRPIDVIQRQTDLCWMAPIDVI